MVVLENDSKGTEEEVKDAEELQRYSASISISIDTECYQLTNAE